MGGPFEPAGWQVVSQQRSAFLNYVEFVVTTRRQEHTGTAAKHMRLACKDRVRRSYVHVCLPTGPTPTLTARLLSYGLAAPELLRQRPQPAATEQRPASLQRSSQLQPARHAGWWDGPLVPVAPQRRAHAPGIWSCCSRPARQHTRMAFRSAACRCPQAIHAAARKVQGLRAAPRRRLKQHPRSVHWRSWLGCDVCAAGEIPACCCGCPARPHRCEASGWVSGRCVGTGSELVAKAGLPTCAALTPR